jgi:hypothetical protein
MVDQHHVTPLAQLTFATKCLDESLIIVALFLE